MRASQLYSFTDLNIGLSQTDEDEEKTIEPLIETLAVQSAEPNPLANLARPNIVVPSGWEPGMPVELPSATIGNLVIQCRCYQVCFLLQFYFLNQRTWLLMSTTSIGLRLETGIGTVLKNYLSSSQVQILRAL